MKIKVNDTLLELIEGDITLQKTECIVNAANSKLLMGSGVAGAIRKRGGSMIQEECNRIGYTPVGKAVLTNGGNLAAKYIIHAVGPRYKEHHEDDKLKNATLNSLKLADTNHLTSITFPAISTGVFGFPEDRCAIIMLSTTIAYLEGPTKLKKVVFCLFTKNILKIFENILVLFQDKVQH